MQMYRIEGYHSWGARYWVSHEVTLDVALQYIARRSGNRYAVVPV